MSELKPCPFCGGEANSEIDDYGMCTEHFVECLSCVARTSTYDSPKEAITAWNTRAKTEAEKKIEQIRACIESYRCKKDEDPFEYGAYVKWRAIYEDIKEILEGEK